MTRRMAPTLGLRRVRGTNRGGEKLLEQQVVKKGIRRERCGQMVTLPSYGSAPQDVLLIFQTNTYYGFCPNLFPL